MHDAIVPNGRLDGSNVGPTVWHRSCLDRRESSCQSNWPAPCSGTIWRKQFEPTVVEMLNCMNERPLLRLCHPGAAIPQSAKNCRSPAARIGSLTPNTNEGHARF